MPPTSTINGSKSERANAHASPEQHLPPIPCKLFKLGACIVGDSCPFPHAAPIPGVQKEICDWFLKGYCKFGHKCPLEHVLPARSIRLDTKNQRVSQLQAEARAALSRSAVEGSWDLESIKGRRPARGRRLIASTNRTTSASHVHKDSEFINSLASPSPKRSRRETTTGMPSALLSTFFGNTEVTSGGTNLNSVSAASKTLNPFMFPLDPSTPRSNAPNPIIVRRRQQQHGSLQQLALSPRCLDPSIPPSLKNPDTSQPLKIFPTAPAEESLLRGQLNPSRNSSDPAASHVLWSKSPYEFKPAINLTLPYQDDMWDESDTIYGPPSPPSLDWLANLPLPARGRNSFGSGAQPRDDEVEFQMQEYFPSLSNLLLPEDRHRRLIWNNLDLAPLSGNNTAVFSILQQILLHDGTSGLPGEDLIWMKGLLASHEEPVLQNLADFVQSQLDFPAHLHTLTSRSDLSKQVFERRCLRILRHLSETHHILPISLTIADIRRHGHHPVAGGGFADIWRGVLGERHVCLKVLRLVTEPDENQFYNEALIWKQLKHPNILPLLGVNVELFSPSFCLISPWMANKDIISYLKQNPSHNRLSVFLDIASGLTYLHTKITHGDIRGANILVTDNLHCCLADFGLALTTSDSQAWSMATTGSMKGSIRWMAPELIDTNSITDQVLKSPSRDIFALGCTMLEISTLQLPFHDQKTDYAVLACLIAGKRPARPKHVWCPDAIWNIIIRCWVQEPANRPRAQEVYEALKLVYDSASEVLVVQLIQQIIE